MGAEQEEGARSEAEPGPNQSRRNGDGRRRRDRPASTPRVVLPRKRAPRLLLTQLQLPTAVLSPPSKPPPPPPGPIATFIQFSTPPPPTPPSPRKNECSEF